MRLRTASAWPNCSLLFHCRAGPRRLPTGCYPVIHNLTPDSSSTVGEIASSRRSGICYEIAKGQRDEYPFTSGDDQTRFEGKLAVGAQATVEYVRRRQKKCVTSSGAQAQE